MQPKLQGLNIVAMCPECGVPSTFIRTDPGANNRELGAYNVPGTYGDERYSNCFYRLYRCVSCGRAGLSKNLFPRQR